MKTGLRTYQPSRKIDYKQLIRRNKKRINYYPHVTAIKSEADLLHEAMEYIYYYNNVREHSALNYHTPFPFLKTQLPDVDDKIRFVIPIMLELRRR